MNLKVRNTEGKEKRIGSLISAVVLFVISALMLGFSFGFSQLNDGSVAGTITLILTIPLLLGYYIASICFSGASLAASIATATSLNRAYRITGIVFSVLSGIMICLNIYTAVVAFGML